MGSRPPIQEIAKYVYARSVSEKSSELPAQTVETSRGPLPSSFDVTARSTAPAVRARYVAPRREGLGWRSSVILTGLGDGERELWFETEVEQPESADPFALLLAPLCLTRGSTLHIDGPVSVGLWRNLHEFAGVFYSTGAHRKDPKAPPPPMTVSRLESPTTSDADPNAAVVGFSGGVDSAFSIMRHTRTLPHDIRYDLKRAVIVHGFDVPLGNTAGFRALVERVRTIPESVGVELVQAATNYREFNPDWEMSHGAAVAAALNLCRGTSAVGLIASGVAYRNLFSPWGSAPYLDHLFSSSSFRIEGDGAVFTRLGKIEGLASWPEIVPALKFCWQGPDPAQNCGTCPKCVVTALYLDLSNVQASPFQTPLREEFLAQAVGSFPHSIVNHNNLTWAIERAGQIGFSAEWVSAAEKWLEPSLVRRVRERIEVNMRRLWWKARRQLRKSR